MDQLAGIGGFVGGQGVEVDLVGHRGELQEHRDQHERGTQHQVGDLDALDAGLGAAGGDAAEDREADQQRPDGGAEVVDAAGHGQALRAGGRVAHHDRQRVGRDLLQREAQADDEQARQHQAVGTAVRRRVEQQRAHRRDQQAQADAVLVADPVEHVRADQLGRHEIDQRAHRVSHVERQRHQLALRLRQVERLLEYRNQDVVAGGHEAPEEEHRDEDAELRPTRLLVGHGIPPCVVVVAAWWLRHPRAHDRRCTGEPWLLPFD